MLAYYGSEVGVSCLWQPIWQPLASLFQEVVAHPREQGGDERDAGNEPKSETGDAPRLEHSDGPPEPKETTRADEDLNDSNVWNTRFVDISTSF